MSSTSASVDVESIVLAVKEDIARNCKAEQIPLFDEMEAGEVLGSSDQNMLFNRIYFSDTFDDAIEAEHLDYYHPLQGSSVAVFIKRVARKLCRGVVEPLCDRQSVHNVSSDALIRQLYFRVNSQDLTIDALARRIELLEIENDRLRRREKDCR
ncbi:hypothetical protein [Adlercreutzia sp. ZJ141]|uniref:hypothetical protein n=1 Tax=Adlercreutzia sp. ZJ141 TaxID=2709406 RepID=UPI0013ED0E22|nr:hypothetical protein [Adlercreutzia sp. ZJ141]